MAALGRLNDCTCPEHTPPGEYVNDCAACTRLHDHFQALGVTARPPAPEERRIRCRASLSLLTHCTQRKGHKGPHSTQNRQGTITWT